MGDIDREDPAYADVHALARAELPAVERALAEAYAGKHARRLAAQEGGEATYLIAWRGEQPLGHLLVRWHGAERDDVPSALRERPYLEDAAVLPVWRSRGIGTRLFEAAHELARARRCGEVGLAVGVENVRARALYARLGYREADLAPFRLTWSYTDAEGRPGTEGEDCVYMVKRLLGPHS
ncbi:MAG TPA: GNAT family N-acetyltransferase, partial [Dehalococcoidia bacterium]|nr:GNAT family N-acetyltransferase [Dehalococcoidia bacterium]